MIHETITLKIDEAHRAALTAANRALGEHIKQRQPVNPAVLARLREQIMLAAARLSGE